MLIVAQKQTIFWYTSYFIDKCSIETVCYNYNNWTFCLVEIDILFVMKFFCYIFDAFKKTIFL